MRMHGNKKYILTALIVLVVVILAISFYRKSHHSPVALSEVTQPKIDYTVELDPSELLKIQPRDVFSKISISGSLTPNTTVQITSPLSGTIQGVYVDVGDRVKKGQVLVVFDQVPLQANLAAQEAALDGAKAQLENAVSVYDRTEALGKNGYASRADVMSNKASVLNLQAQVRKISADIDNVKQQLDQATVRAPFDGIVSARSVDAGQSVGMSSALLGVVDVRNMEFQANIPSVRIADIYVGQKANLSVLGIDGKDFPAIVKRISPVALSNSRSIPVYFQVDNSGSMLRGGMFATGYLITDRKDNVIAVPDWAVTQGVDQNGKAASFIYKGVNGKIVYQEVKIGHVWNDQQMVEVTSGLKVGDELILSPLNAQDVNVPYRVVKV